MDVTSISKWQQIFDDLVIELSETNPPEAQSGTWHEALARFSRHSFARLLLTADERDLTLRLEAVLGPGDSRASLLAEALKKRLQRVSETDWTAATDESPWIFTATFPADGERSEELVGRLLRDILSLSDEFERISTADQWLSVLGKPRGDEEPDDASSSPDTEEEPSGSPFETIGDGSFCEEGATIVATDVQRSDDSLILGLGFSQVLPPRQIDALQDGLEAHIHTKFDAQVRLADEEVELDISSSARTVLTLRILIGGYPDGLSSLSDELRSFLERLDKFSSLGVDLFEYLGVSDTVLDSYSGAPSQPLTRRTPSDDSAEPRRSQVPSEGGDDGFVFDFGASKQSPARDSLHPGEFNDPRLQREDAETPLVDMVLRHPGYSDRRIGQVLSILLSIEYHDAINIAESAPCVIAWGLGRQRAHSFKEVIESAGGKAVLVEPGTFGER